MLRPGTSVADKIGADLPPGTAAVRVAPLDLADPASVASFVRSWTGPLDILVNNAGVMALPQLTCTPPGYECNSPPTTSVISRWPQACIGGWPRRRAPAWCPLLRSGTCSPPVVFDDLHYRFRPYDQWTSYGQSKSANVLFAVGAAQRWADDGIAVNALMPGNIASTRARATHGRGRPCQFRRNDRLGAAPSEDDRARRGYLGPTGGKS